jgi:uncharacterized damage-inducible protein DinB
MTPEQAKAAAEAMLPNLQREAQTTKRVVAALPDDRSDYKPHEKSMSAIELARHTAFSDLFFINGIITGAFTRPDDSGLDAINTGAKVAAMYEREMPKMLEQLAALPGEALAKPITFANWTMPAVAFLNFALVHTVHHRGQLSVYLRLVGAKVPAIYGGSADEPMAASA